VKSSTTEKLPAGVDDIINAKDDYESLPATQEFLAKSAEPARERVTKISGELQGQPRVVTPRSIDVERRTGAAAERDNFEKDAHRLRAERDTALRDKREREANLRDTQERLAARERDIKCLRTELESLREEFHIIHEEKRKSAAGRSRADGALHEKLAERDSAVKLLKDETERFEAIDKERKLRIATLEAQVQELLAQSDLLSAIRRLEVVIRAVEKETRAGDKRARSNN